MQATEFTWTPIDGWTGLEEGPNEPDLVLFFGPRHVMASGKVYTTLRERFPQTVIAGSSGGGQIYSNGILDDGITGLVMKFDSSHIKIASASTPDSYESFTIGENLGRSLLGRSLKGVLLLADGLDINGDQLLAGLAQSLPSHVTIRRRHGG